jgi:lycopene beta-cyclase
MSNHSDLIILGGGCAGLSLGMNLANYGEASPRTLILEGRQEYTNDRTWCFWGGFGSGSEKLPTHRWESFSIATAKDRITRSCKENPYLMVASKDFYQAAVGAIDQSSWINLKMESIVSGEVLKRGGLWHVETPMGVYTAPQIVDTRPKVPHFGHFEPLLWQSFLGEEITTEEEIFDPGCAELMDFSGSSSERILFLYVLPFSKKKALVEATVFGPEPLKAEDLEESFGVLVKQRLQGSPYSSGRKEHGILPMGAPPESRQTDPSYVRAGLMAGGARPSSGYAFQRIWKWSQECAIVLAKGRPPISHPQDPPIIRTMDALFLHVLYSRPELAPDLFFSLFSKVDPVRVARFMSDRASLADCLTIMASLPPVPFLSELAKTVGLSYGNRTRRGKKEKGKR